MRYLKPAITISDQVARLKARGLMFGNEPEAELYLSNISYYRLRAYTYSFQNNTDPWHPFIFPVTFEQIIGLYLFDRQLSHHLFIALEKIEIALRTQIIYHWAMSNGSHWQIDPSLYRDPAKFAKQINSLQTEIDRSHETFIEHYYTTYSEPSAITNLEKSFRQNKPRALIQMATGSGKTFTAITSVYRLLKLKDDNNNNVVRRILFLVDTKSTFLSSYKCL